MDNFRKTLAYKICGYSFFVLIVVIIFCVLYVMSGVAMWHDIVLMLLGLGILVVAPPVILLLLIILSIIAFLTQKKYAGAKHSILADIGYVCMLIISGLYVLFLPSIMTNHIDTKKRQKAHQEYLKNEYPTVVKNSCALLNNHLPKIVENLGEDFTKEQLANELAKIETITNVKSYENGYGVISYYRDEPVDTYFRGKRPEHIYIVLNTFEQPCDIDKANCYIYLEMHEGFGDCKFYFDKNGKTIPTEETLQLIQ